MNSINIEQSSVSEDQNSQNTAMSKEYMQNTIQMAKEDYKIK